MRDAWERNSEDWIRWARTPDVDHFFWRLNLPSLLELLPPPGRLTLDVGAGEGRLSRELHALGHRVVAIEPSPVLARAAREASPQIEVVEAPAEAIPLEDGAADLAVASMSLMNIDVLHDALAEIGRILSPGGRLAFSIPHPASSAGDDYFTEHDHVDVRVRGGARMEFHDRHRPLSAYFAALAGAGFVVEELREPVPDDDYVAAFAEVAVWRRRPCFLQVRAARA